MADIPVLYVFVRTDLASMTPGKAQAHSGHAANAFINQHYIKQLNRGNGIATPVLEWMAATPFGFGTQINLKGEWEDVVGTAAVVSESGKGVCEIVTDPTYPYIVDREIVGLIDPKLHSVEPTQLDDGRWLCHRHQHTAAYIFGYKSELEPYVGQYPLHP